VLTWQFLVQFYTFNYTHTHTRLKALCPGLPGWAGTRKVKPIWILLKQETVSGIGISWAICMSAPRSRQITVPAPHHSVFYRQNALPAAQPTASKHWRHTRSIKCVKFANVRYYLTVHFIVALMWPSSSLMLLRKLLKMELFTRSRIGRLTTNYTNTCCISILWQLTNITYCKWEWRFCCVTYTFLNYMSH